MCTSCAPESKAARALKISAARLNSTCPKVVTSRQMVRYGLVTPDHERLPFCSRQSLKKNGMVFSASLNLARIFYPPFLGLKWREGCMDYWFNKREGFGFEN
jgi:hypothetical protein